MFTINANWKVSSLTVNKTKRWYQVYTPPNLKDKAPVIFILHGGGGSMKKIFTKRGGGILGYIDIANKHGLLLVAPNGTNAKNGDTKGDKQHWNDLRGDGPLSNKETKDVLFIQKLTKEIISKYSVNSKKLYITGASNGGMMTFKMLLKKPNLFAAGVAFIASLPANPKSPLSPTGMPVPLMMMNGTKDRLIKWDGGKVARKNGETISINDTRKFWIKNNQVTPAPQSITKLPNINTQDGCTVTHTIYEAKNKNGRPFHFLKLEGAGHNVPTIDHPLKIRRFAKRIIGNECHDIEGAVYAWAFMNKF
jgi:polyhydroxybutyrate depolymerase